MKKLLLSALLSSSVGLAQTETTIINEIKEGTKDVKEQLSEVVTESIEYIKETVDAVQNSEVMQEVKEMGNQALIEFPKDVAQTSVAIAQTVVQRTVELLEDAKEELSQTEIAQITQEVIEQVFHDAKEDTQTAKDFAQRVIAAVQQTASAARKKASRVMDKATAKARKAGRTIAKTSRAIAHHSADALVEVGQQLADAPAQIWEDLTGK